MAIFRYSIVRYVPDPVRGEQVNVGLVVGNGDSFDARFLNRAQLNRLSRMGFADDFGFIAELASEIADSATGRQLDFSSAGGPSWTLPIVERAVTEWANTVQFSALHAAEHDGDLRELTAALFARYVAPPRPPRKRARDKRWVKRKVTTGLRHAISAADRDPDAVIRQDERVAGRFDEHTFDYALLNGQLQHLIETMSFETADRRTLRTEVDALAWAIDDVRRADSGVPITVATIGKGKMLDDTQRIYGELDASVLREDQIDPWVTRVSQSLVASLTG